MRTENHFVVMIFFSLLSLAATIIFSGTLLSRTNELLSKFEESEK
ncbi:hypothetical protein [Rossellomorea vietnamensis]|nr:hypothetical protein [Rossellomorea vietnamensis]